MKRFLGLFICILSLFAVIACAKSDNMPIERKKAKSTRWRIAMVNQNSMNIITQYKYSKEGNIEEITEYESLKIGSQPEAQQYLVVRSRIFFDEDGNVSGGTTTGENSYVEKIDNRTWRKYDDFFSVTVSLNEQYQYETEKREWFLWIGEGEEGKNALNGRTIISYAFDRNGIVISSIEEQDFFDSSGEKLEEQYIMKKCSYEYEYDRNGNPVIQYMISDEGKQITATYSWEEY